MKPAPSSPDHLNTSPIYNSNIDRTVDNQSRKIPRSKKILAEKNPVNPGKPALDNTGEYKKPVVHSRQSTATQSIYEKCFSSDDEEGSAAKKAVPVDGRSHSPKSTRQNRIFLKDNSTLMGHTKPVDPCSAHVAKCETEEHKQDKDLIISVQSLAKRYELRLSSNSAIEQLRNSIWQTIDTGVERCQKESHVLLLFNHRMHIFLGEEIELVGDFTKLRSLEPHFYFYALKRYQQSDEMYTYEAKTTDLFTIGEYWWNPVHFVEDVQLPRPQSVLLSSLYVLHLFFRK